MGRRQEEVLGSTPGWLGKAGQVHYSCPRLCFQTCTTLVSAPESLMGPAEATSGLEGGRCTGQGGWFSGHQVMPAKLDPWLAGPQAVPGTRAHANCMQLPGNQESLLLPGALVSALQSLIRCS